MKTVSVKFTQIAFNENSQKLICWVRFGLELHPNYDNRLQTNTLALLLQNLLLPMWVEYQEDYNEYGCKCHNTYIFTSYSAVINLVNCK